MRKNKTFELFGLKIRCTQFSAMKGIELLDDKFDTHPCIMLGESDVLFGEDWLSLSETENVNKYLCDRAGVLPPVKVLESVLELIREFNFGFLNGWEGAKVPSRFVEESNSISSKHTTSLISQLFQDDAASIRELEEYYSLEDAFRMFDILMVKGINQALSNEAAIKKNARK